jgi:hypothetical protein
MRAATTRMLGSECTCSVLNRCYAKFSPTDIRFHDRLGYLCDLQRTARKPQNSPAGVFECWLGSGFLTDESLGQFSVLSEVRSGVIPKNLRFHSN